MVAGGRQVLGLALAITGFLGSIIICALPAWKVTVSSGANIITPQAIWEGLWMNCVTQSTGQMHCKVYDSLLALPQDLQVARALVIISIMVEIFGILLGVVGVKYTKFVLDKRQKSRAAIASGVVFIIAGLLVFIPVRWTTNTIISDFYNPITIQWKMLGTSLNIGWASAGLLFLGGGLLCCSCTLKDETSYEVRYSNARSV